MNNALDEYFVRAGIGEMLARDGFVLDPSKTERISTFLDLIREWNRFASLVSVRDVAEQLEAHVVDSLSLAPCLGRGEVQGRLLDIGSGGGFPAIPLLILCEGLTADLVERSTHKIGFLQRTVGTLGLADRARVVAGSFPQSGDIDGAAWVTARAVEKQDRLHKDLAKRLGPETVFLCQGEPGPSLRSGPFEVVAVEDEWGAQGLRRGKVYRVRRG